MSVRTLRMVPTWTCNFIMREIVSNIGVWCIFLNMALWTDNAYCYVPNLHDLYIARMVSLFIMHSIVSYDIWVQIRQIGSLSDIWVFMLPHLKLAVASYCLKVIALRPFRRFYYWPYPVDVSIPGKLVKTLENVILFSYVS